ncbi:uncharacterized protein [Miscanthus floridulus]|uniref:uncharacterized protein n=1 Tax=Miscanthus floridulus TaxID=154761 RepID=UPI003457599E
MVTTRCLRVWEAKHLGLVWAGASVGQATWCGPVWAADGPADGVGRRLGRRNGAEGWCGRARVRGRRRGVGGYLGRWWGRPVVWVGAGVGPAAWCGRVPRAVVGPAGGVGGRLGQRNGAGASVGGCGRGAGGVVYVGVGGRRQGLVWVGSGAAGRH